MNHDAAKDSAAVLLTTNESQDQATVDSRAAANGTVAPHALNGSADALHDRGVHLINTGKAAEALPLLRHAVQMKPESADIHHNLGVALAHCNQLDEAVAEFNEAIRIKPEGASALSNLGLALSQQGKIEEAIAAFEKCLRLEPDAVDVLHRLANVLRGARRHAEALPHIKKAVELRPDNAELHHSLGLTFADHGQKEAAIAAYRESLRLHPKYADALNNLGIVLQDAGQSDEAIESYRKALRLRPHSSETYNNLGVALAARERVDDAIMAYRSALQLQPNSAAAYGNLGNAFRQAGLVDDAIAALDKALEINPEYSEGHNNKAVALVQAGEPAQAVASYGRALELKPDYPDAYLNRALARLLIDDYAGGLEDYEWRWRRPGRGMPDWGRPNWDGDDPVGRVILLWGEQGLGDSLQYCRYAQVLAARGAVPILCVPELLVRLLRTIPGVFRVESSSDRLPPYSCHAPLMSMMRLIKMRTLDDAPAPVPYLKADPEAAAACRGRVRAGADLVVGIVWRGNPQYAGDKIRSVSPELFAPLAKIPGVRVVSLMKDATDQERTAAGAEDIGATAWSDFAEAAESVVNVDLVISVDTAAAHLAGALGLPVWIALPSAPDMRWGLGRANSPWYPTARLFRQERRSGWEPVFVRIAAELEVIARRGLHPAQTVGKGSAADALHTRGLALLGEGNPAEGAAYLQDAVRFDPANPAMRLNLGVAFAQLQRLDEALHEFQKCVGLDSESALGNANLGLAHIQMGRHAEAARVLEVAARVDPQSADVQNHLGIALAQIGREEEAAQCYARAIELKPGWHAPLTNLGNLRRGQGRLEESLGHYDEAIRLCPADPDIFNNRGMALDAMLASEQAMADYERALGLNPDHVETRFNRALALLLQGDYQRGLAEYEWRWRRPGGAMPHRKAPLWDGEVQPGKTLLVWQEQGLGDMIHGCRFVPLIAERGMRVIVQAAPALAPLLRTLPGVADVVTGDAEPNCDVHAPVMSLARLWGMTRLEDTPAFASYLSADPEAAKACRDRVRAGAEFVVGIAWRGNPHHAGDRVRSASPEMFACLDDIPGVRLVSVSTDASADERAKAGAADIGAAAWPDFAAAAAAFANLDLVICVDTAAGHLAGALGIPVWIALPSAPDWRWGLERDDSPWYPTARLFRQESRGEWQPALERIAAELARRAAEARTATAALPRSRKPRREATTPRLAK